VKSRRVNILNIARWPNPHRSNGHSPRKRADGSTGLTRRSVEVETGDGLSIPNLFAVVTMVLWARNSDRTNERHLHVAIACFAAGIGMLISGHASQVIVLIIGLSIANFGINAAKPPLWSMPTQFLSGSAAAGGIALINAMGSLIGGTVGPMVIGRLRDISGDYSLGLYFVSATLLVSAALAYLFGLRARHGGARHVLR
jgi:ACS family tartrate transporter-like MFS transporter